MIGHAGRSLILGAAVIGLTGAQSHTPGSTTQSSCQRAAMVWCFRDTAEATDGAVPNVSSTWIIFVRGGDSAEVTVIPSVGGAAITTTLGQDMIGRMTAPFVRRRIAESATVTEGTGRFECKRWRCSCQRYAVVSFLWLPSHSGGVLVRLQVQNQTSSVFSGLNSRGENGEPLCEPSQNGWRFERPQAHHQ